MTVTLKDLELELAVKVGEAERALRVALRDFLGAIEMDDVLAIEGFEWTAGAAAARAKTLMDEPDRSC